MARYNVHGTEGVTIPNELNMLIVDDNRDLLKFLERLLVNVGWHVSIAENVSAARQLARPTAFDSALIDYMLPDGDGVELAVSLKQAKAVSDAIIITGTVLSPEDEATCEEQDIPVLRKPFLPQEVLTFIAERQKRINIGEQPNLVEPHSRALKVFFSYSHEDEKLRDRLDAHLSALKHMEIVHSWHDRKIGPGTDVAAAINMQLETADLILLLISPDFMRSDYCYTKEMSRALERHRKGEARVIPVILRPVDWEKTPFADLQVLPSDAKPVTLWTNRDEALMRVAKAVRTVAEELAATIRR